MKNTQEYNMLINLRQAIVGKAAAQKRADELQRTVDSFKFTMSEPSQISSTKHVNQLECAFDAPYQRSAEKAANIWYGIKLGILILLALAALIGGGYLTYITVVWSWNSTVGSMTGMTYLSDVLTYDLAVGIHMFGLAFVILLAGIILECVCLSWDSSDSWWQILLMIVTFALFALAIYVFCVACSYYYSTVSGFWAVLLTFLGSFLAIPLVLRSMLFILCIIVVAALTVGAVVLMIFLCTRCENNYQEPSVNRSELYESKKYKEAEKADKIETQKLRDEYSVKYKSEKEKFDNQKAAYQKAVQQYRCIVSKCDQAIRQITCLHSSYKNLKSLDIILYYIDYNRADTIKEAINEYFHDQQVIALLDKLDSIDSKLDQLTALQQQQLNEMRQGVQSIETKMEKMSCAIISSINAVGNALDTTLLMINKNNNRNAERQLQVDGEISNKLSYIDEKLYHIQHRL